MGRGSSPKLSTNYSLQFMIIYLKFMGFPDYLAARFGHLPAVVWLVESEGCSASDKAQNGVTPVHLAAAKGSINCLRWLTQNDLKSATCISKLCIMKLYFWDVYHIIYTVR